MINSMNLKNLSHVKQSFLYVVETGDNLKIIADKFNTTQRVLIMINGLENEVKVGEYILIEQLDGIKYIVKPGDTLEQIATYSKDSLQSIKIRNKIDDVYVGQKIYI